MAHMRERAKVCKICLRAVRVLADMDMKVVRDVTRSPECIHPEDCWRELTSDIFDTPFDEGLRDGD